MNSSPVYQILFIEGGSGIKPRVFLVLLFRLLKMLIIFSCIPVPAPGKSMGSEQFPRQILMVDFVGKIPASIPIFYSLCRFTVKLPIL